MNEWLQQLGDLFKHTLHKHKDSESKLLHAFQCHAKQTNACTCDRNMIKYTYYDVRILGHHRNKHCMSGCSAAGVHIWCWCFDSLYRLYIYLFVSPLEDDCKRSVSNEVFSTVFKVSHCLHVFFSQVMQVMEMPSGASASNSLSSRQASHPPDCWWLYSLIQMVVLNDCLKDLKSV